MKCVGLHREKNVETEVETELRKNKPLRPIQISRCPFDYLKCKYVSDFVIQSNKANTYKSRTSFKTGLAVRQGTLKKKEYYTPLDIMLKLPQSALNSIS